MTKKHKKKSHMSLKQSSSTPRLSIIQRWYPFIIILGVNLIVLLTYPGKSLYGDSQAYMALSKLFVSNGHFSLLNYSNILRGYFFPLLLQIPIQISNLTGINELLCFRVLSAVAAAISFGFIFPAFFEKLFNFQAKPIQILIFGGLITFFWYGNYAYPLSDFPAITFFLLGISLCLIVLKSKKAVWFRGLLLLIAGFCLAAATSIRPSYIIPFFVLILLFIIRLILDKLSIISKATLATSLIIGCIVIFTPQTLINRQHYQVTSPFQLNKVSDNTSLIVAQLYDGLNLQKVDFGASVGGKVTPNSILPEVQGTDILKKDEPGKTADNFGLKDYLNIVLRNPVDMACLYIRHLFNGLDTVYPATYVPNVYGNQIFYRFLNYSLWFLSILLLWRRGIKFRKDKEILVGLFIMALSAVLSIPGMVEVRFFIPIYLLMYGCIGFWFFSQRNYWRFILKWRYAISYICFIAVCFMLSSYLSSTVGILIQN